MFGLMAMEAILPVGGISAIRTDCRDLLQINGRQYGPVMRPRCTAILRNKQRERER